MGRHDHVTCVRSDGLSAVLSPLLDDTRIVAATLVDVDSGFVLDGWSDAPDLTDLELLGAGHADLVRAALTVRGARGPAPVSPVELTVEVGDGRHHVLAGVADPHGDRLVVAVVVDGRPRHVERARRRLRAVPASALTAGPSLRRRPVDGTWFPDTAPTPTAPAHPPTHPPEVPAVVLPPPSTPGAQAAPPAAMIPTPSARS